MRYGKIGAMTQCVRVATPRGIVETLETATGSSDLEGLHKTIAETIANATVQTGARL